MGTGSTATGRRDYECRAQARVDSLARRIRTLRRRLETEVMDGRVDMSDCLLAACRQASTQLAAVEHQLFTLKCTAAPEWEAERARFVTTWEDLAHAVRNIMKRLPVNDRTKTHSE